jgi:hypothetical protein
MMLSLFLDEDEADSDRGREMSEISTIWREMRWSLVLNGRPEKTDLNLSGT